MTELALPRGMKDLLPNAALFRNELIAKVEKVFQTFGFLTIDTPMLESIDILKAKGGIGEESKLIFETTEDNLGLRYDLTVSLSRYIAMHQELPMPFKRYAIGKAWRREEPQHLRHREFTQADVDIVGGDAAQTTAEVIAAAGRAFDEIGIGYIVRINSRSVMNAVLDKFGVEPKMHTDVMRIVDKLDKVGRDKILEMLGELGLQRDIISRIDNLINMQGSNSEKFAYIATLSIEEGTLAELKGVLELLPAYQLKGSVMLDFSIVRGLDYYTGVVFEFSDASGKERASIGAGGRYDGLIGLYGSRSLPAVGASIGINRILDILGFEKSEKMTYAKLFVINVKKENYQYAVKVANWFRLKGVPTDINLSQRNISNQLSYANSLKFGFAAIIGDAEQSQNKIKLRDLVSGEENEMSIEEALFAIEKR
jgi:histidyl-tRNA synthetase